jgi:hypothetical protein
MNLKSILFGSVMSMAVFALSNCSDDGEPSISGIPYDTTAIGPVVECSSCTYTVPSKTTLVDGKELGIKPGDIICLNSNNIYKNIVFRNIVGSASAPVLITNCGGQVVTLDATDKGFGIKTQQSKYFRITGGSGTPYGIKVIGGYQSVHLEMFSTNFEVDHLEISNSGFAGIMAKTDPTCDDATLRGNFVMYDISLHHNYVHDTGGEGFYIGHTFYLGASTPCGVRLPHVIEGLKIFNNVVRNTGWDGIQVGSTPKGAKVYHNKVENYGVKNEIYQNNGVQLGAGAPAEFYGNLIKDGPGMGLIILENAENFAHDNVFINTGADGIFCDERSADGPGFKFINNTIINPGANGIKIYAEKVPMNIVLNNIIVNPGNYSTYTYPRAGDDAYVFLLSKAVKAEISNNYLTRDINSLKFANAGGHDYRLTSSSPVIDKGYDIKSYDIAVDFLQLPRLSGTAYDIGAFEY